jgi:hypothetical protein
MQALLQQLLLLVPQAPLLLRPALLQLGLLKLRYHYLGLLLLLLQLLCLHQRHSGLYPSLQQQSPTALPALLRP